MKLRLTFIGILLFGTSCFLAASVPEVNNVKATNSPMNMVLDLDTGIDDAMALAYAVASNQVNLLGVTCSYGNVSLEQGVRNTLNLLNLLGQTKVPVYAGTTHSLGSSIVYQPDEITREFHGTNGIGEVTIAQSKQRIQQENAVDFLIRMANTHSQKLTIVAVGPLTNLALAMERDPSFEEKVGKIVIMGGALTVPGNMNPWAEANIYHDPLAARKVLRSKAKITLVGLDVTLRTLLTKEQTQKWRSLHTPTSLAYADMIDYYIDVSHRYEPESDGCALHDPLAVAVAIDPSLVTTFGLNLEVGTNQEEYGRTIGDKTRLLDEEPNVSVCINVDHKTFIQRFVTHLNKIFARPL